jgi:phosphatidylinositol 3-kinase
MKLCSEMVAAMGGEDSKDFTLFKQLCVEAFNILRKNANLILNLISLMADANIPDIASEKNLLLVKFCPSDISMKIRGIFFNHISLD